MIVFHFWDGVEKLTIAQNPDATLPSNINRLVAVKDCVFLLDASNHLWLGTIKEGQLTVNCTNVSATGIAATSTHFYFINEFGRVFKASFPLNNVEEVTLFEEANCCIHGYTTSSRRITVRQISAGSCSVIYVSDAGELWASGEHPSLHINEGDGPKKVPFFEGHHITSISSGDDFHVVVAHKKDHSCSVANGSVQNGCDTEVFLNTCPQCANENIVSPLSPQSSSENCPLGMKFQKSSESISISTSTSKEIEERKGIRSDYGNSSSSTEDSPQMSKHTDYTIIGSNDVKDIDEDRGDKVSSMLLINTEAAKQFLTRQLSRVSTGGEELLAEVSVPTRIIKQNVSNMASFVYEGVKTVSDKVATLSRHVSGGSDNNSNSFEEFEELNHSNGSMSSSYRWDVSCSEVSEDVIANKNGSCVNRGSHLTKSEVWAWGSASSGQLGKGDMVRRPKPVAVNQVSNIGVINVWCGKSHCLAHTLDGRVFGWGSNSECQLTDNYKDHLSPVFCGKAKSVAAGQNHSILLSNDGSLKWLYYRENSLNNIHPDGANMEGLTPLKVLSNGNITCLVLSKTIKEINTTISDLAHEQCFLEELVSIQNVIVKPLSRKSCLDDTISNLCSKHTDLTHFTAAVVSQLLQGKPSSLVLAENQEEHIAIYERYLSSVCDVISINGFTQISKAVETPPRIVSCFSDRLPTRKTSAEAVLTCVFTQPLSRIAVYKGMVSRGGCNGVKLWENIFDIQEAKRKEAEDTKTFWESAGRHLESLRTPKRRLIRDSRTCPLSLFNSSRFSSHWFILLSDALVHISGSTTQIHSLDTVWVEMSHETEPALNGLLLTMPEETLTLTAPSHQEKTAWLKAFQATIRAHLNKAGEAAARTASYKFTRHFLYKDAKYNGRWFMGKMEGSGTMHWPEGKTYTGQFHNNLCHGYGRLEIPGNSVYEGQWKDGYQNGHGATRYENGDIYTGYYKDGLENGHGVRKAGRFTSSQASVYVGEWVLGLKHGYGVMNSIGTGEKYLGFWSHDLKNGPGLIVTVDGMYYEGNFTQDSLVGHGVVVFEDGTHYEGEVKEAGIFNGKGTLTFLSGDRFEGTLLGTYMDGVKVSGTFYKNFPNTSSEPVSSKPSSFGELCVKADHKWKAIFKQCWTVLGVSNEGKAQDTQKAWENIAVVLGNRQSGARHPELLQTISQWGQTELDLESYKKLSSYLHQAFESIHHPLGRTLFELVEAYTTTYGGVVVHPLLLSHAVAELRSITSRLYQIVRLLFPALPEPNTGINLSDNSSLDVACMPCLMHPIILPRLYSSLVVLYALHNKTEDDIYWKRLLKWNRHPDSTLFAFLDVDKKFWMAEDGILKQENLFGSAIETLQQLKTTFSPMEKLLVIQNTFQELNHVARELLGENYMWTMDDLFPVSYYVVVRSHIVSLGSEINFIEDFMKDFNASRLIDGKLEVMFTTIKACYLQTLQEKMSI